MTDDPAKHLADLFDGGDTVMLMTMIDMDHSSRPMTVARVEAGRLSFLVDATADWYAPVQSGTAVCHITLSDVRHNEFAALNGRAHTTRDRQDIEALWNVGASAYFEGKDDPNIAVMHFDVTEGQYWDGPSGRLGSLLAMAKAKVSGAEAAGEHGSIAPN
jgi:general stress protein 26